jgi:hypothetical protein
MCRGLTQAAHMPYLLKELGALICAPTSFSPTIVSEKRRKISDIAGFRLISRILK